MRGRQAAAFGRGQAALASLVPAGRAFARQGRLSLTDYICLSDGHSDLSLRRECAALPAAVRPRPAQRRPPRAERAALHYLDVQAARRDHCG